MRDAWQDLGGDWSQMQVVTCATNSAAEAEQRAAELLAGPDAPDAVAAMSDELALGVLRAADHLSRRIPGDLTVTGWDDPLRPAQPASPPSPSRYETKAPTAPASPSTRRLTTRTNPTGP
jgi:DNA-binding LacI/PurR family transcriptional regulator